MLCTVSNLWFEHHPSLEWCIQTLNSTLDNRHCRGCCRSNMSHCISIKMAYRSLWIYRRVPYLTTEPSGQACTHNSFSYCGLETVKSRWFWRLRCRLEIPKVWSKSNEALMHKRQNAGVYVLEGPKWTTRQSSTAPHRLNQSSYLDGVSNKCYSWQRYRKHKGIFLSILELSTHSKARIYWPPT